MKENTNEKVIDINEEIENETIVIEKVGVVQKFKEMPTWQKALIIGAAGAGLFFGGKKLYSMFNAKDVVDTVVDAAPEVAKEMVTI